MNFFAFFNKVCTWSYLYILLFYYQVCILSYLYSLSGGALLGRGKSCWSMPQNRQGDSLQMGEKEGKESRVHLKMSVTGERQKLRNTQPNCLIFQTSYKLIVE